LKEMKESKKLSRVVLPPFLHEHGV